MCLIVYIQFWTEKVRDDEQITLKKFRPVPGFCKMKRPSFHFLTKTELSCYFSSKSGDSVSLFCEGAVVLAR